MAVFGGMNITNRGIALQGKAQAGAQLNYTRIAIGDGSLSGQSIPALNALISPKMNLTITRLQMQPPNKAVIGTVLNNAAVTSGFFFREVGVFAQDPDLGEILYAYANAGVTADYIPAGGGSDIVEKVFDCRVVVGTAANITAEIDESLVYALQRDFDAKFNATTGHKHTGAAGDGPQITAAGLAAGAATDTVIGNRTIVDTEAPTDNTGTPTKLWGWLAYMIKAITGKNIWWTKPAIDLEATKIHVDDTTRHITAAERTSWNGKIAASSADVAATANTIVTRDTNGNVNASSLRLDATGRIATANAMSAVGQGGIIQMTSDIGMASGYGSWQCYNCYWDGVNWIQPRGNLPSYAYTVNNHLKFSWRFAAASGTNGAVITLSEVAVMDYAGLFNPKGGLNLGNGAGSPQSGVIFKPADNASWFWLADISGTLTFGKDGVFGTNPIATLTPGGEFSAAILSSNQGSESLRLKPGTLDHTFMALYARSANSTIRSGWFGFGTAGNANMTIANQLAGNLILSTVGAGEVQTTGNLSVPSLSLTGPQQRKFTGGSLDTKIYENLFYVSSNSASTTGTLKITLPKSWNNTMMRIKISGYNYNSSHGAWELLLGGYNFTGSGGMWYNTTAVLTGAAPFTSVRFAHDGSNCCILLGTTSLTWNYPKIVISEFTATSGVFDGWETGWAMGIITDETGITVSSTPTINSGTTVDMLDGFHAQAATAANTIPVRDSNQNINAAQFTSNAAQGTAPFNVSSTTPVPNLNVDLIDGLHASDFARNGVISNNVALNTYTTGGTYRLNQTHPDAPTTAYGYGNMLVLRGGTGDSAAQLIIPYNTDDIVFRRGNPSQVGGSGSYSAWTKVWNAGNDGSGSGLDADLLEGYHGSVTSQASTIPVRGADKKIAEVAANRAVAKDTALTTATVAIATHTPAVAGLYTVKISAGLSTAAGITINVSYTGPRGAKSVSVVAEYSLAADDYYFVPVTFMASAGAAISVTASSTTTGAAWASAVITEEG